MTDYYRLFVDFNSLRHCNPNNRPNHCKFCDHHCTPNEISIEKHILLDCPSLRHQREYYWTCVHNELVDVYNKPHNTHNMRFAQTALEAIEEMCSHHQTSNLWQVISGANTVFTDPVDNILKLRWTNLTWRKWRHFYSHSKS
eukprot:357463_1